MTEQEVGKLIKVVKAVYPSYYSKYSTQDYQNMITGWIVVLSDFTFEQASAGLRVYLRSDSKGFPPSPGQVANEILKIEEASNIDMEMSALEAWSLVRKAIQRSGYYAEEEFSKLPPICQRVIGNPSNLHEMSQLKSDIVGSVEQSHFIAGYNAELQRQKEQNRMPLDVQQMIARKRAEGIAERKDSMTEIEQREERKGIEYNPTGDYTAPKISWKEHSKERKQAE